MCLAKENVFLKERRSSIFKQKKNKAVVLCTLRLIKEQKDIIY
jgi:hypothetical protein